MMKDWGVGNNWTFPDDAEEHYKDINLKAAKFRTANIHDYAGFAGSLKTFFRDIQISETLFLLRSI